MYLDVADINMVEISEENVVGNSVETTLPEEKLQMDAQMVTEDHKSDDAMVTEDQLAEKMKVAYPRAEEDLIDFLKRCKISNTNYAMRQMQCSFRQRSCEVRGRFSTTGKKESQMD